mmetsp:Transcript_112762/g.364181  ORF Transcript_112762/g.364181 Transcript_112762/m.364181 type:complete len:251 (+) Transcript_112762:280-1032(+)
MGLRRSGPRGQLRTAASAAGLPPRRRPPPRHPRRRHPGRGAPPRSPASGPAASRVAASTDPTTPRSSRSSPSSSPPPPQPPPQPPRALARGAPPPTSPFRPRVHGVGPPGPTFTVAMAFQRRIVSSAQPSISLRKSSWQLATARCTASMRPMRPCCDEPFAASWAARCSATRRCISFEASSLALILATRSTASCSRRAPSAVSRARLSEPHCSCKALRALEAAVVSRWRPSTSPCSDLAKSSTPSCVAAT